MFHKFEMRFLVHVFVVVVVAAAAVPLTVIAAVAISFFWPL